MTLESLRIPRSLLTVKLAFCLTACQNTPLWDCEHPCKTCRDPCCEENDCVPVPELGWDGPVQVWMGPEAAAPGCPEGASALVYEGHEGLHVEDHCAPCACEPPACKLPDAIVASDISTCPNDGPGAQTFAAPAGWTGECVAPGVIADGMNNAVASITFPATEIIPCTPKAGPAPTAGSFTWTTLARACRSPKVTIGVCAEENLSCAPALAEAPSGFRHCVFKEGEHMQCPTDYPERRVFYGRIDGEVQCAACTCGPPQGSECKADIFAYSDDVCGVWISFQSPELQMSACNDYALPGDLRSMDATWLVNSPGTCAPGGGGITGEAHPADPSTFCCR
jgi:hypothetical protein